MRRTLKGLLLTMILMIIPHLAIADQGFFSPDAAIGAGKEGQDLPWIASLDVFAPTDCWQPFKAAYDTKCTEIKTKHRKHGDRRREALMQAGECWAKDCLEAMQKCKRIGSGTQASAELISIPIDLPWIFYPNLARNMDIKRFWVSADNGRTWYPGAELPQTGWGAMIPPNSLMPGRVTHLMGKILDRSGRAYIRIFVLRTSWKTKGTQWPNMQFMLTEPVEGDTSNFTRDDWFRCCLGINQAWTPNPRLVVNQTSANGADRDGNNGSQGTEAQKPQTGTIRIELRNANGSYYKKGLKVKLVGHDGNGQHLVERVITIDYMGSVEVEDLPLGNFYTVLIPTTQCIYWNLPEPERRIDVPLGKNSKAWQLVSEERTIALTRKGMAR